RPACRHDPVKATLDATVVAGARRSISRATEGAELGGVPAALIPKNAPPAAATTATARMISATGLGRPSQVGRRGSGGGRSRNSRTASAPGPWARRTWRASSAPLLWLGDTLGVE